ncbi:MAG: LCP family protein [Spirochaetaceae bacterium]|nr:LCP family protein [Spirochaetaceae bacterium]
MKGRQIKTDASIFLLAAIVVLLGAGVFFTLTALRQDPIEEALSADRVINILFVFESEGKPLASYVLMYYPGTKRAAVVDVPGELGLIIRRINRVDRIDTVYGPSHITMFETEVEDVLGIDINFFIVYDLPNLGKMVDLIEGVELFIPAAVSVYESDNLILFPSGITRLDGDKVRSFLTYQLPEEDRDLVTFRRQRFFLGFIKRLGEKNEVLKNSAMIHAVQPLMKTGMNQRTRIRLFDELSNIDADRMNIQSVGGNYREVSGQMLLFPYYDGTLIKEIVRQSLSALTRQVEGSLTERVFTVEVLNGTGVTGLAGRTAELLRGFGYDVISIGNADRSDYEATEIIDRSGSTEAAQIFAEIIRCTNLRSEAVTPAELDIELNTGLNNLEYRSDFTLVVGRDFNGRYVTGE